MKKRGAYQKIREYFKELLFIVSFVSDWILGQIYIGQLCQGLLYVG
jgi:hypothetical protein